jgi:hypothetical protein
MRAGERSGLLTRIAQREAIKTYQGAGKKFNVNDVLADLELEAIRAAKSKDGNRSEPERVVCWCAEGIVNGRRVAVHRSSDCEYVAARSALVPEASRLATERIGEPIGNAATGYRWTAEFVRILDRLAYSAGLLQ